MKEQRQSAQPQTAQSSQDEKLLPSLMPRQGARKGNGKNSFPNRVFIGVLHLSLSDKRRDED